MSKRYFIHWLCLLLMAIVTLPMYAQTQATVRTVNGSVVDENGEPIVGATVMVQGGSAGTSTDMDGKFTLKVPEKRKLEVTFIGYVKQIVSNLNNPRIVLKEDLNMMEEVVALGYGSGKAKNVTGSVEVIRADELKDLSVSNLSEALVGLSPSIHVDMPTSGRPGETATITIRQAKSAVALVPTGTDQGGQSIGGVDDPTPLFVIDDFISTEEDFNNLDVDEVETITILKDASAAVYGSYCAYGVILVKTKRGEAGAPKISYNGTFGFVDAIKHADMLSAYDYARIYNAAAGSRYKNSTSSLSKQYDFFQADEMKAMKSLNYDLLDKYWSSSLTQQHNISLSGGTEKATYYGNVSYYTQDGNIGKLDYDRWNYRAGINANISKYVKAALTVSGNYSTKNSHMASSGGSGSNEDYSYMLFNPRYVPDQIGEYPIYHSGMNNDPSFSNYYNYQSLYQSRNNKENTSNDMSIQASLEHDFSWLKPLKGLRVKFTYTKSVNNDKTNNIRMENTVYRVRNRGGSGNHLYVTDPNQLIDNYPTIDYDPDLLEGIPFTSYDNLEKRVLNDGQNSYISRTMSRSDSYQMNLMFIYGRKFGKHDISATFSIEKAENESEDVEAMGTAPLSFTDGQSTSLSDESEKTVSWGRSEGGRLAYIGRVNYAYADKYLFEFLFRSQASTKFSPDNYWGYFPSLSAGWVLSEENWFDKEKLGIDFFKIRASFGILGRDNVEAWRWCQLYDYKEYGSAIFGTDPTTISAKSFKLPEKSGTNPNLRWDKNYQTDLGIDITTLNNRLSITMDGYYTFAREMFVVPSAWQLPGTVGIYAAPENWGKMDSYGVELQVKWRERINKDLQFTVGLGTGYDDNKLIQAAFSQDPTFGDQVKNKRSDRGLWGLSCIGMFRSYQEIEEYFDKYMKQADGTYGSYLGLSKSEVHPGMLIYEDIRGAKDENGNYTAPDGNIDSDLDLVEISHRQNNPYNLNFNLNVIYKSFSLQATTQAEWGAYTLVPSALRSESFDSMETKNVSSMWKNMFIYEDVLDANGEVIAWANRGGNMPNLRYSDINSKASTFWRMSAAKVMLRNITLAYTLPKRWTSHWGVSNVRLNLTCQNAWSFYNPIPGKVWDTYAGTYGNYPTTRKITMGLKVSF